jgi:hypothetical protein
MICPHCGKETGEVHTTLKVTRIKNLQITSWCEFCKKPKGYSGTLMMGDANDEATEEVPEMCMCAFYQQQPPPLYFPGPINILK